VTYQNLQRNTNFITNMQKTTTAHSTARQNDLTQIFDTIEYPDAYRITYLANSIVFPTYAAIKRDFGLVRAEYILLACLSHYNELTARDVAQISMRPRNTISSAVHRMVGEQLIERRHNRVDKREASLTITKKGQRLHKRIAAYLAQRQEDVFTGLNAQERQELSKLLRKTALHTAALNQ